MAQDTDSLGQSVDTPHGSVQYLDDGDGDPVLFVHGSPGGCDEGALMTRFMVDAGFRVVSLSRPGYLDTPLTDANATPERQAEMELALMDALGVDRFTAMCWSGGGPSTYRLAATSPERVRAVVAIAAVSKPYTFASSASAHLLEGRIGTWLIDEMAKHAPKSLIKSTVKEEGELDRKQLKELTEQIWSDEDKRDFVVSLSQIVAGRKAGLENDKEQFPKIGDLGLSTIEPPTLLVHGTADADVPPEYSDFALEQLPNAQIERIENGTHISAWVDPNADRIQQRIVDFVRAS